MLLTNITNAVVTTTQIILSNVIVELRVVSALLAKFAVKPTGALRAKCRHWHAASQHSSHHRDFRPTDMRDPGRGMCGPSMSCCGYTVGFCGYGS